MFKAVLYTSVVAVHMAVNESHTVESTAPATAGAAEASPTMTSDRYCRHCTEIALAYDPSADRARCRACGELA